MNDDIVKSYIYIVIPCYNCADTIERCVHSILYSAAVCREIKHRIILIDDASTDNTHNVLAALARERLEVMAFHNDYNLGPGATRNYGMDIVMGLRPDETDYIWFIDADDYIEAGTFLKLRKIVPMVPDIICMSRYQNGDDITPFPDEYYHFDLDNPDIDKLNYIQRVKLIRAAWDKLYRFDMCRDCRFAVSVRRDEESLFTFMAYLKAVDIVTLSDKFYHYDFTDHGLSANLNINENIYTWEKIAEEIRNNPDLKTKYPKLIPYVFEKNVYDITITLAEQMDIGINKDKLRLKTDRLILYAMGGDQNEKMDSSI